MTLAPQTPDPTAYTKKLDLLDLGETLITSPWLRDITLREIQICEVLRLHPHPNVCHYRGVVVTQNLVTGLVFDRYAGTLADLIDSQSDSHFTITAFPVDIPTCLAHVAAGLTHLHELGFVHCDIKPDNIFVDAANQRYVIGDFDAVHVQGDRLSLKCGTKGWVPEDEDTDDLALKQTDWYSVHMLAEYLEARKRGDRGIWYAETEISRDLAPPADLWQWDMKPRKIDLTKVYPLYNDSMTIATRKNMPYVKEVSLLLLGPNIFRLPYTFAVTLCDIQTCELLRRNPHPNICSYRGINLDGENGIIGLVFDRHDVDLRALVKSGQPFDAAACMRDVENAVRHLHSLGLIHYDLNPTNVLYDAKAGRFVLGDLDASQQIGMQVRYKRGMEGFCPPMKRSTDIACPSMDWYGLEVLKFWLQKKGNGKAEDRAVMPKTRAILEEAAELFKGKRFGPP
ncbi:kinase-like domain-containing protein [Paraphoma chrysanthemicola]|uniref:Kinase-like domain-containing protein n=1 Tax=Paraphoma chrysanthemicola TaxID=798071 RepID=A0A8K0R6Y4_9PLEO|nr:kinase-like domain-containing protein [Paraphoma chrysanthemicola]